MSKYNSHSEPLYKKLGFLKVDDIFKLIQQLTFYYKYLHDNLPAYLQNWKLIPNDNVHTHDTRIKNELYIFRAKHEFAKNCLRHNLPFIVNNIPDIVKEKLITHSLNGFAKYVKQNLLQTYNDACTITNCYICNMQN